MCSAYGFDVRSDLMNLLIACFDRPEAAAADDAVEPSKNRLITAGNLEWLSRGLRIALRPLSRLACDLASALRAAEIIGLFADICFDVFLSVGQGYFSYEHEFT